MLFAEHTVDVRWISQSFCLRSAYVSSCGSINSERVYLRSVLVVALVALLAWRRVLPHGAHRRRATARHHRSPRTCLPCRDGRSAYRSPRLLMAGLPWGCAAQKRASSL